MALTLALAASRLVDEIKTITRDEALRRVNRAYRAVSIAHPWRHLLKRFTLQTEASYNTGTIALTTQTTAVTLTGGTWTTSWSTAPSHRRMAIQGRSEPYDVTTFGSTTTATLADSYIGSTLTAGTYNLFRDTYPLPADCGYAKLCALYDPERRHRLLFFNQNEFLNVRSNNPTLASVPECFTIVGQTTETPPRPQIQIYPAASAIRSYHGWYFKRPSFLTAEAAYFDWPEDYEEMIPLLAMIEYYETPLRLSQKMLGVLKPKYADLFGRMKTDMDGAGAMEYAIQEAQLGRPSAGWNPDPNGLAGSSTVSW